MKPGIVAAMLLGVGLVGPVGRLEAQGDREEILKSLRHLFDGMRGRDTALMRAQFSPNAKLAGVDGRDGQSRHTLDDPSAWITAVGKGTGPAWDERIFEPVVQVDGNIAHVWTYYEFWLGPKLSHCGYDSIFFVRLKEGWKIGQVADSRRTDCKPRG
ncbi:MAG: nuclear transport factor 2 family protein [Gemmatimonadales bacterium]